MRGMRQAGQRRNAIHRSIENQFGPLRRTSIFESLGLQSTLIDQISSFLNQLVRRAAWLEWAEPSRGVQFILHVSIAVLGPAHKRRAAKHLAFCMLSKNLFATEAVLRRDYRSVIETAPDRRD